MITIGRIPQKLQRFFRPVKTLPVLPRCKRYEFGCKVSVALTNDSNWIVGVEALHANPYDGHTLAGAIEQVERITGREVHEAFVDKGYRGHDYVGAAQVHITGQRSKEPAGEALRKRKKRRSAVEPKIGHLKSDNRMGRNFLKGVMGDQINALLAGIGANLRKLLAVFWPALREELQKIGCWLRIYWTAADLGKEPAA